MHHDADEYASVPVHLQTLVFRSSLLLGVMDLSCGKLPFSGLLCAMPIEHKYWDSHLGTVNTSEVGLHCTGINAVRM